jgi:hypothetical protein
MKKPRKIVKSILSVALPLLLIISSANVVAQDSVEKEKPKAARPTFESAWIMDNQTDVVNKKGTLEMMIQHRFGTVENGSSDLWGVFAPGNIRLGFTYSFLDNLSLGFGAAKVNVANPVMDGNVKYKILQQTRGNEMPVNLTYYGVVGLDTRSSSNFNNDLGRLSYFNQLIISRRFNSRISLQLTGNFSHFNSVDSLYSNDVFGIGIGARYKVSPQMAITLDWLEPFNKHEINSVADESLRREAGPNRNVAIGVEIATSSHAFQVFFTTYRDNLMQYNMHYNTNAWTTTLNDENRLRFLLGFNITRLWHW